MSIADPGAGAGPVESRKAARSEATAPAASASLRACTSASGRPGPTRSPGPATSLIPMAWSIDWSARVRPPPSASTAMPTDRVSTARIQASVSISAAITTGARGR